MAYLKIGKIWAVLACVPVFLLLTGCGGVSASHAVSPASFSLPELMQYTPQEPLETTPDDTQVLCTVQETDYNE